MLRFCCVLCSSLFMISFFQSKAMNVAVFDHCSSFNEVMRRTYFSLKSASNEEILDKFKECCINSISIDPGINAELHNIVQNPAGCETLRVITARLYPYVKCANSLEILINAIPYSKQNEASAIINKAKSVVLFCKALGVHQADVFSTLLDIGNLLQKLKNEPVLFPDPSTPYQSGSLLDVFKCDIFF